MNPGPVSRRPPALWLALALLGAAGAAKAETSPYYIGASLGLTRAVNPFLDPDNVEPPAGVSRNDTVTTAELLAGIDQNIGRQHLFGTASVRDNRWQNNSQLNGIGYDLSLGLDFATVERLTGKVTLAANQNLTPGDPGRTIRVYSRNLRNTDSIDAIVNYGVGTNLSAYLGGGYRSVRYTSPAFDYLEYTQDNFSFGLNYTEGGALTLGVGPTFARGTYPYATCQRLDNGDPLPDAQCTGNTADDYTRRGANVTANWVANGVSTVFGLLGYYNESHSIPTSGDLGGAYGVVQWTWKPTGKLKVVSSLQRSNGQDQSFENQTNGVNSPFNQIDYSNFTNTARVVADYAVSAKVTLDGTLQYARRSLSQTKTPGSGPSVATSGNDNTTLVTLAATWTPTRSSQLGCTVNSQRRTSSYTAGSYPYNASTLGCTAQLTLR